MVYCYGEYLKCGFGLRILVWIFGFLFKVIIWFGGRWRERLKVYFFLIILILFFLIKRNSLVF